MPVDGNNSSRERVSLDDFPSKTVKYISKNNRQQSCFSDFPFFLLKFNNFFGTFSSLPPSGLHSVNMCGNRFAIVFLLFAYGSRDVLCGQTQEVSTFRRGRPRSLDPCSVPNARTGSAITRYTRFLCVICLLHAAATAVG